MSSSGTDDPGPGDLAVIPAVVAAAAAKPTRRAARSAAAKRPAGRPRSPGRLTELDGMRALMFLVVTFHAYQASVGDLTPNAFRTFSTPGIIFGNIDSLLPIFFLLSGFALYYQMLGGIMLGRPLPNSGNFLFKRALRLIPVYLVVFLVVWFWRFGGGSAQWLDLAWGLSLMQTWSTDHIFRTIDPGWYLSIEWQFAVVSAFVILPWLKQIAKWPLRSRLVGALVPPFVLIGITIWWKQSLADHRVPGDHWGSWFAPPSWGMLYGVGMLLGMALVLLPPARWRLPRPFPTLLFVSGTAWVMWLATMRGVSEFTTQWYFELALFGTLSWLLAALTADPEGRMRRLLRSRLIQTLAAASFATYLVHAPFLRSLNARNILPMNDPALWPFSVVALLIIVLPLGYLAFRYIEMPLSGLDKLLQPKLDHELQITKVTKPTLADGTPLPDLSARDAWGHERRLRELASSGGLLLLVHPSDPVPRGHPRLHGTRATLRTFDSTRPAAAGYGVRMAALSPRVPDEAEAGAPAHPIDATDEAPNPIIHLQDPKAQIATSLGLLVVRTAAGRQQPEVALLAIDGSGTIVAVVRDDDPHRLVRVGLEHLTGGSEAGAPAVSPRPVPAV